MRRHLLVSYFLIAYAVTWPIGLVFIVLLHRLPSLEVIVPMIAGPTIAALIMTAVAEGRPGVGRLLRRYVLWRVDLAWYVLVLVGIPALLLLSILVVPGGADIVSHIMPSYPLAYVVALFVGGALFEEPGWRGFALPRLQEQLGPLRGTLLLGVVWAFWHLPLFFVPGFNGAGSDFVGIAAAVVSFLVGTTAMAVIFTWVFNNTRGSLLVAILLHASLDTAGPSFGSLLIFGALYVGIAALALIVIVATRGRLSYERFEPNWRPLPQCRRRDDDRLTSVHRTRA
jgi:membrane protease YdiL (CAAX protease family)